MNIWIPKKLGYFLTRFSKGFYYIELRDSQITTWGSGDLNT